jgi:beta-lactam-binding protein with PASTA domain
MRTSIRAALLTLTVAGAGLAAAPAAHAGPTDPAPPALRVIVPEVRGQSLGDAKLLLVKSGLAIGTATGVETCLSFGRVLAQDPLAETLVLRGSAVNLLVSIAPERGCEGDAAA